MKNTFVILFCLLSTLLFAQSKQSKYSRVKVFLHETPISTLGKLGLEYDHGFIAKGKFWINDVSAEDLAIIKANNLTYEILVDDVQAWYLEQNEKANTEALKTRNEDNCQDEGNLITYETPANYTFGSMGGYHTYAELLDVLDDMKAKFPNLISERQPIGDYLTHEGRPIYWLKVGVNPNEDEDKPAIFYNSLHHAREPNSLSQMLFFIWHLLENYETDAEVKYIMENVEMYFVPCINPDGYVYNETTNPSGGGLWRKNRWVNGQNETVGVDLNRNYGFSWGLDNTGSSSNQVSQIYRGTAPFSEPETQAIRDFCIQHQFAITLNYHSFSNLLIIPWGFENSLTPDDATYRALTSKMTEQNNYFVGTGLETVGYTVNGDSDDWMYGEQEQKPKIFSMTPEVGPATFGFWPPSSAIDQLNKDNLWQNITAAGILKPYGEILEMSSSTLKEEIGTMTFAFQNIGLEAGEFTVSVQSLNENLAIISEPFTVSAAHLAMDTFNLDYMVEEMNEAVQNFDIAFTISNGAIERKVIITKDFFATSFEFLFSDNIDADLVNWAATDTWNTTDQTFFSANHSITDSPFGNYQDRTSSFIETNNPIDLANAEAAQLQFQTRFVIENNFDFVQILISTDQTNFTPLCGNLSSKNGRDEPAYTGVQNDWILEEIDLEAYLGQQVYFRFQLDTDDFVTEDGFYFDDFNVEVLNSAGTTSTIEPTFLKENSFKIFPNPFKSNLNLSFELAKKEATLVLQLQNMLGQTITTQTFQNLGLGNHQFQLNLPDIESGIYFLHLQNSANQSITKKIFKVE